MKSPRQVKRRSRLKSGQTLCAAPVVFPSIVQCLRPLKLSRYLRSPYKEPPEVNEMKLRSLVLRLIVVWMPVLPPTPLIARAQREAPSMATPVHVTAEARHGTEVFVIHR